MYPNFINHLRRFIEISDDEILTLLKFIKPLYVKKKSYLLKEGQICKANYFVEEGCLRMFFINDKGIEKTTQFALESWWLSDYMSFANQVPSAFNIQAIETAELLCIDHKIQDELFKELPQLERYFRIIFQRANAASQFRIKFLYDLSKEDSFHHFNKTYPEFVQRVPQYMLASFLGLTPEYLSELRKKK